MSSTFFTASPQWGWLIVGYFFLGGIAAGSYVLATLMELFGPREDRPLVRLGYLIAFPTVCLCGLLLTADLGRPERFWHMLVQANTFRPMVKAYAPMSLGAWALMLFSACAFLSFVAVLGEGGRPAWPVLARLRRWLGPPAALGRLVGGIGALLGLYVAGYTGVLLAVTNRPIWADTTFLGLTFLISAMSTSAALLILLGSWEGLSLDRLRALERFDRSALILEALAIAVVIASLGRLATVWLNGWGVLLVGMMLGGIALPLLLESSSGARASRGRTASARVLAGGLILRAVIVFSSDGLP